MKENEESQLDGKALLVKFKHLIPITIAQPLTSLSKTSVVSTLSDCLSKPAASVVNGW